MLRRHSAAPLGELHRPRSGVEARPCSLRPVARSRRFFMEGDSPGAPINVDFFRGVLSKFEKKWSREDYPDRMQDRFNALQWVATQPPDVRSLSVEMPSGCTTAGKLHFSAFDN